MSKRVEVNIRCPDCGHQQNAVLFRSLWIEDGENRSLMLTNKINLFICDKCEHTESLEYPFLCTNVKRGLAIWYEPYHDAQIDADVEGYRKHMGANSFYAKAPRIADWNAFKAKFLEMEAAGPQPGQEPMRSKEILKVGPGKYDFMGASARMWFDELVRDSARPKGPQQIKDDFALALKWLDVAKPSDIRPEHYDRWAAGFIAYLAEGKSPSAGLGTVFGFFKGCPSPTTNFLNDEIRGVFDRMLATDAEIAARKGDRRTIKHLPFNDFDMSGITNAVNDYKGRGLQADYNVDQKTSGMVSITFGSPLQPGSFVVFEVYKIARAGWFKDKSHWVVQLLSQGPNSALEKHGCVAGSMQATALRNAELDLKHGFLSVCSFELAATA